VLIYLITRKSQSRREAVAESHGSFHQLKIAGLPGMRQHGFFVGALGRDVKKLNNIFAILNIP
jgi:hypothetical protein